MGRTIANDNHGFSKRGAEIRRAYLDNEVKHRQPKLSADFKKIVNQDSYGVQRKEIK